LQSASIFAATMRLLVGDRVRSPMTYFVLSNHRHHIARHLPNCLGGGIMNMVPENCKPCQRVFLDCSQRAIPCKRIDVKQKRIAVSVNATVQDRISKIGGRFCVSSRFQKIGALLQVHFHGLFVQWLRSWSRRLDVDNVRANAQLVQIIRPALHHGSACWQVGCAVVGPSVRVFDRMC